MLEGYLQLERINLSVIEAEKRVSSTMLIENNFEESVACEQGARCLKCHIDTIFNGEFCILCNGCVDVCPTYCLTLIPLSQIKMQPQLESMFNERYGLDIKQLAETDGYNAVKSIGSAMLKDEELCIRCGYCAERCPTSAITMEHFSYQQKFSMI